MALNNFKCNHLTLSTLSLVNVKKTEVLKICDDKTLMNRMIEGSQLTSKRRTQYFSATCNSDALCDEEVTSRLTIARNRRVNPVHCGETGQLVTC